MQSFKRKTYGKQLSENLGLASSRNAVIKEVIEQIGEDDQPLNSDAVYNQSFDIESKGGTNSLKIRGMYLKQSPFCGYLANEPTGDTIERPMPLPRVPIDVLGDVESIPQEIRDDVEKGKVLNYLYEKKDESGKVVSEARQDDKGKWIKMDLYVPTYRQYLNDKGLPWGTNQRTGELIKTDGEDEKGRYKITEADYVHAALTDIGFFIGHSVTDKNVEIPNTRGVYMIPGDSEVEKNFSRLYPTKAGGTVSISSKLRKVFAHSLYGVVSDEHISKDGYLLEGKFVYAGNKPVRVAVYDGENNVAAILDRDAFKLTDFKVKRKRNTDSLPDDLQEEAGLKKEEEKVTESTDVSDSLI